MSFKIISHPWMLFLLLLYWYNKTHYNGTMALYADVSLNGAFISIENADYDYYRLLGYAELCSISNLLTYFQEGRGNSRFFKMVAEDFLDWFVKFGNVLNPLINNKKILTNFIVNFKPKLGDWNVCFNKELSTKMPYCTFPEMAWAKN